MGCAPFDPRHGRSGGGGGRRHGCGARGRRTGTPAIGCHANHRCRRRRRSAVGLRGCPLDVADVPPVRRGGENRGLVSIRAGSRVGVADGRNRGCHYPRSPRRATTGARAGHGRRAGVGGAGRLAVLLRPLDPGGAAVAPRLGDRFGIGSGFLDELRQRIDATPDGSVIRIANRAQKYRFEAGSRTNGVVFILAGRSVRAWAELEFPERRIRVEDLSRARCLATATEATWVPQPDELLILLERPLPVSPRSPATGADPPAPGAPPR